MASGTTPTTKILLAEDILTINPADFSALGTGYTARKTLNLNGFYTAAVNAQAFTPGTNYLDTAVPDIEIVHRYRYAAGYASYYKPAPYTMLAAGFAPLVVEQEVDVITNVQVVSNVPPISILGTLQIDYYTSSNSPTTAGSAYYAQDFLYKIWAPIF